jgi:hypothetical protein
MALKGKIFTEEHKVKLSLAKKLNPVRYWSGKMFSDEYKKKLSTTRINGDYSGENSPRWKGGISHICPKCKGDKPNYSAKMCFSCWLKEESRIESLRGERPNTRGDKNHNWKGGLSGEDYLERRRFGKMMQKLVFKRDNYKCQICGNGGNLQVDHVKKWSEHPDIRFDINNCRTLCAECHYELTFNKKMPKTVKGWGHNLLRRIAI